MAIGIEGGWTSSDDLTGVIGGETGGADPTGVEGAETSSADPTGGADRTGARDRDTTGRVKSYPWYALCVKQLNALQLFSDGDLFLESWNG